MKAMRKLAALMILGAATACAPVVYEAGYADYEYAPRPAYRQPVYVPARPVYVTPAPVVGLDVTLHAGTVYAGWSFSSLQLVIMDRQFVPVPVRDRHGRPSTLYMHYVNNDLHFDADRHCRPLGGHARFPYDRRWESGHRYSDIAADGYDLRGLQVEVRSRRQGAQRHEAQHPAIDNRHDRYDGRRAQDRREPQRFEPSRQDRDRGYDGRRYDARPSRERAPAPAPVVRTQPRERQPQIAAPTYRQPARSAPAPVVAEEQERRSGMEVVRRLAAERAQKPREVAPAQRPGHAGTVAREERAVKAVKSDKAVEPQKPVKTLRRVLVRKPAGDAQEVEAETVATAAEAPERRTTGIFRRGGEGAR